MSTAAVSFKVRTGSIVSDMVTKASIGNDCDILIGVDNAENTLKIVKKHTTSKISAYVKFKTVTPDTKLPDGLFIGILSSKKFKDINSHFSNDPRTFVILDREETNFTKLFVLGDDRKSKFEIPLSDFIQKKLEKAIDINRDRIFTLSISSEEFSKLKRLSSFFDSDKISEHVYVAFQKAEDDTYTVKLVFGEGNGYRAEYVLSEGVVTQDDMERLKANAIRDSLKTNVNEFDYVLKYINHSKGVLSVISPESTIDIILNAPGGLIFTEHLEVYKDANWNDLNVNASGDYIDGDGNVVDKSTVRDFGAIMDVHYGLMPLSQQ